ncbi:MAG: sensor histidine kinase [Chloroflexi bacterium]|nr:sensor histidine kinase [Chloroflexota bacterium]
MAQQADTPRNQLYVNVFRLVITVRLMAVVITALFFAALGREEVAVLVFSALAMFACLLYLSFPSLLHPLRISYAYLAALFIVTVVVFEQRSIITALDAWRIDAGWIADFTTPNLNGINLRLALVVLVAWGYSWRRTMIYCLYVLVIELIALVVVSDAAVLDLASVRAPLINLTTGLVVGYVVSRLVQYQTQQQRELETAHTQLAQYAVTVEKLSISRERNRLARELHDTLAHTLSAATVKLNAIQVVWDANPTKARSMLMEVIAAMNEGMIEVRRALRDLRSTPLEDLGLRLALEQVAQSAAQRGSLRLDLDLPPTFDGLTPDDEQGIYRIMQEALENVVRHAQAEHLSVIALAEDMHYCFCIQDDGIGFDVKRTHSQSHFGLNGMIQRAILMGGDLHITSTPGAGTKVEFTVRKHS